MKRIGRSLGAAGFTLTEVMVASAVSAVMFSAMVYTAVSFNRVFAATEDFSVATSQQQRAIDYVSRDLRRAYKITVSADGKTLSMTIPDSYSAYDSDGNPTGSPIIAATKYPAGLINPVVHSGVVDYNDPTKPLSVSYYINGQNFIRQQTIGATNATSTLVICDYIADFQSSFTDSTSIVTFSLSFAPNFQSAAGREAASRSYTTLTARTAVRNLRRD